MFDDTCRFLAEHFSEDFARWLLGTAQPLTELQPSELSLDPLRRWDRQAIERSAASGAVDRSN